jgi:hypothetical protein
LQAVVLLSLILMIWTHIIAKVLTFRNDYSSSKILPGYMLVVVLWSLEDPLDCF